MRLILAITGASGTIYAENLLKVLAKNNNVETHLIVSNVAKKIMGIEGVSLSSLRDLASKAYENSDLSAAPASGTFHWDSMVVIPCSMKSLSAIANGLELNLLLRAAQVTLKENRQLIVAPRETPLNSIQIENMLNLSKAGATVLPLCPAFYHKPSDILDLVDFISGKILNLLHLKQEILREWNEGMNDEY
ncbi:MAG: UbiX family flavin prenyltransferase [Candidatus Korarchaeota archaeon]|nr:UbiX family flavin prenyltransferase [Candidatus Korarchaeota archaeon]NIU85326.1 UbiX family flavin prenyltransferase [Candidatus Thorarchaeota archaeon]NIW13959.1 UbiX family flavin prenyltransferase [Candidatus Thorarchaeota archaeon]NIW52098.1 UbiX family flavin prenyltransferase [Candidatus Korarchaeota archaeon]